MQNRYVLFGAGITGMATLRYYGRDAIVAVIDNDPKKVGSIYEGIPVISFETYLKDYKDFDVLVEGNTDNVPISKTNIRNNWDLSALRASSIVQVLQNNFGIDPKRMSAAGRGEFNPISDNDSELGKQRNRRTEIIITPKLDEFMDLIDKAPETED